MITKISIPRWTFCIGVGMAVGFLYFVAGLLLSHRNWFHKTDGGWLDAVDMVLGNLPFGYYGVSVGSDGEINYLVNGLFWAALGGGLCALRLWRKNKSQPTRA